MDYVGIICEYNPFHEGHAWQIKKTKEAFGGLPVICLMSGAYVQRGEPAVLEKHARARAAIESGADAVLELPFPFSLLPAQLYAEKALFIMNSLGIKNISFGAEDPDVMLLTQAAENLMSQSFQKAFKNNLNENKYKGFPEVRAKTYRQLYQNSEIIEKSNNILGIEYITAIIKNNYPITPRAIKRIGADEQDGTPSLPLPSATGIRNGIFSGENPRGMTKATVSEIEKAEKDGSFPIQIKNGEKALIYTLRNKRADEINKCFGLSGLGKRLNLAAKSSISFSELQEKFGMKHITGAREKRAILSAFLDIRESDVREEPSYTVLLAANQNGLRFVKDRKKLFPVITKPSAYKKLPENALRQYERAIRAENAAMLFMPRYGEDGSFLRISPTVYN